MSTSIKFKLIPSNNVNKAGIISLQLIHNRIAKRARIGFRLFPSEWDIQKETVLFENADAERKIYLQSIRTGLDNVRDQLLELIRLLERKNAYTVDELYDLYVSKSFGGLFSHFIDYVTNSLIADNRMKTAHNCTTAKLSFALFLSGQDVLIDEIDNGLMRKYESHLKLKGIAKNTIASYMRSLRSVYNKAVERGLTTQKDPFAGIFTGIDKTEKRAVNEDILAHIKKK